MRFVLWSSVSIFDTHLAHNLWYCKCSVTISCSEEREMCGKCVLSSDVVNLLFSRIFSFTWSSRSALRTRGHFDHHRGHSSSLHWTSTPPSHHSITHSVFSINLTKLPINFCRANILAFRNLITDRISQVAGFSIFVLISRQNDEFINKEWEVTMCLM
jgi:hypothetical protein